MEIVAKSVNGQHDEYVVAMGGGQQAFLTVRRGSHPLRVDSGSASGGTISTSSDQTAAVDRASLWLLERLRTEAP
jgi:hypothetical protein